MRPLFVQLKVNNKNFFINSNEIEIIKVGHDNDHTCIILKNGNSYEMPIKMKEFVESFRYNPHIVYPSYY